MMISVQLSTYLPDSIGVDTIAKSDRLFERLTGSLRQIIHLGQLNLFNRRDVMALLEGDSPESPDSPLQAKLRLL